MSKVEDETDEMRAAKKKALDEDRDYKEMKRKSEVSVKCGK